MSAPLLSMKGITKRFLGAVALNDISLSLSAGEVLALVGENGAGKSTLMKILAGAQSQDSGTIEFDGKPAFLGSIRAAKRLGIVLIHQELMLAPYLNIAANIFLGSECESRRELGMGLALLVIGAGLWLSNSDFLGPANTLNLLRQIAMLGIFAIGEGFVIISGGIDLSVGSMIGLVGVIIAKLSGTHTGGYGFSLWIAIPAAVATALLLGLCQGLLITRLKLQPFIVTLAGMLLFRGASQAIAGGGTLSLAGSPLLKLSSGGFLAPHGEALLPYPLLIFFAVIIVAVYLLHLSVYGRYIYSIGGNREAAEYSRVPVKGVETSVYVISASLAAVAGICYAAYIGQMSQQVGIAYELYAIAAVVLGGCSLRGSEGTVLGIVIGAAIMRVIDNGTNMFQVRYVDGEGIPRLWRLDSNWTFLIMGSVILVAVVLDQSLHLIRGAPPNSRRDRRGERSRRRRMSQRILITGAAGKVGQNVIPKFLSKPRFDIMGILADSDTPADRESARTADNQHETPKNYRSTVISSVR